MVFSIEREDGGTGRHVGFRFLFARVRVQVPFPANMKTGRETGLQCLLGKSVGLEAMLIGPKNIILMIRPLYSTKRGPNIRFSVLGPKSTK